MYSYDSIKYQHDELRPHSCQADSPTRLTRMSRRARNICPSLSLTDNQLPLRATFDDSFTSSDINVGRCCAFCLTQKWSVTSLTKNTIQSAIYLRICHTPLNALMNLWLGKGCIWYWQMTKYQCAPTLLQWEYFSQKRMTWKSILVPDSNEDSYNAFNSPSGTLVHCGKDAQYNTHNRLNSYAGWLLMTGHWTLHLSITAILCPPFNMYHTVRIH